VLAVAALVTRFRSFLETLVVSDLSPRTIQIHVDNIWAFGGKSSAYLFSGSVPLPVLLLSRGRCAERVSSVWIDRH
jgi:hypothetical protein